VQDTLRISDTSGRGQKNRPVTIARAFREGEIRNFAQASIASKPLLTQCDVKNRWPDGSLKYALVSFVVPELPAKGSVEVSFSNQAESNNGDYQTQANLLDPSYDFDALIEMNGKNVQNVSAREMLAKGHYRYWLQGPIVTVVIIEDRSPERSYDRDFGDGSKHSTLFLRLVLSGSKKVELALCSGKRLGKLGRLALMRDWHTALCYGRLRAPRIRFSEPAFTHIGRTRWHKTFWIGENPPGIRIDHNFSYWTSTRAIPNWDSSIRVTGSLIASRVGGDSAVDRIEGTEKGIGRYEKYLRQGGASDWIGMAPTWDILYLYSMDDRLLRTSLSNADLAGRIPWNFREADPKAGTGHFFDADGKVDTFGRVVSVNARKRVTLSDLSQTCSDGIGQDKIETGAVDDQGWITTRDHMADVAYIPYLFTGHYYSLEALQMQAAFIIGWKIGCTEESYNRQGDEGFLHDTEVRGNAWSFRTLAYAAFISPDGSPEKTYFEDKLLNNIAEWEGVHEIPLDIPGKRKGWAFGHDRARDPRGASSLGFWADRGLEFVQPPLKPTAKGGASPWEENFIMNALGVASQFGYPTTSLLQFGARRLINQVLNPATFPEYIEAYRYPTSNSSGKWISNWVEYNSYFDYKPSQGQWKMDETLDHSYGFIAMAALSHMVTLSVDGYSGSAA
jgi:hypothetical protein